MDAKKVNGSHIGAHATITRRYDGRGKDVVSGRLEAVDHGRHRTSLTLTAFGQQVDVTLQDGDEVTVIGPDGSPYIS
ncbi:hypothetical protein [Kineococcus aurantiacus]|uniref:hypothetical protein n=1 Tax=Kineococcus aurantiacus TaxID=37633 RepID=UPI0031D56598